jgi:hypothetical protein
MFTDHKSIRSRFEILNRRISTGIIFTLYGVAVLVFIVTGLRGNPYHTGGLSNHRFFAYNSSVQLLWAAMGALFCFWAARFARKNKAGGTRTSWIWACASAAFVWAAYDEMFEVHERLSPIIEHSVTFLAGARDVLISFYGIVAIVCTIILLRDLLRVRKAIPFYLLGLCLFLLSAVLDYIPHIEFSVTLSIIEELSEYIAGTSFAVAFFLYGLDRYHLALSNMIMKLDQTAAAASLNKSTTLASTVTLPIVDPFSGLNP